MWTNYGKQPRGFIEVVGVLSILSLTGEILLLFVCDMSVAGLERCLKRGLSCVMNM